MAAPLAQPHDEPLAARDRHGRVGVQALYEDCGCRKAGERHPFPDLPVYAVMLAELPLVQEHSD